MHVLSALFFGVCCGSTLMAVDPSKDLLSRIARDPARPANPGSLAFSFADVVAKVQPAVVTVYPARYVAAGEEGNVGSPFDLGSPRPEARPPEEVRGTGSGVIVTHDGYILTNDHVIAGAAKIFVHQPARDEDWQATLIGTDPFTDIALLKIEVQELPALTFADSSAVRPGDVVLALGSPFGLEQTVTLGIVSATGRTMGFIKNGFEDFIQTDASINPGNSGGALVDGLGRLIGVNSARFAGEFAAASGIGFAIPANLALRVADDLLRYGHVRRGFLGVRMQAKDPAQRLAGRNGSMPVRVTEIEAGSPADKAGFRVDDLIVALNGKPVVSLAKLRYAIAVMEPGIDAEFQIKRDEIPINLRAKLGEAPPERTTYRPAANPAAHPVVLQPGLEIVDLTDELRFEHKIPSSVKGVLISKAADSEGHALGSLQAGTVITSINGSEVTKAFAANDVFRKASAGTVMLKVWKQSGDDFAAVMKIEKPIVPPNSK